MRTLTRPRSKSSGSSSIGNTALFSEKPGRTTLIEHHIHTRPGETVRKRPYWIAEAQRKAVKQEVKVILRMGVVEESNSAWCGPIMLVPKLDSSLCFCNDFRGVNDISLFDAYPMPRVDKLIDRLGKARFISTLDLTKGYWQVPLAASSREKTAFLTPDGLYQYQVLPLGLRGAPPTFQRLMDKLLRPHQQYAVTNHSQGWEEHLTRLMLSDKPGLTVNPQEMQTSVRGGGVPGIFDRTGERQAPGEEGSCGK